MATAHTATPRPTGRDDEIRIVSHSTLFYWWIVWAVGFLMAAITWLVPPHYAVAIVPKGTEAYSGADLSRIDGKRGDKTTNIASPDKRDILVVPAGKHLLAKDPRAKEPEPEDPYLHISASKSPGVLFFTVLLLVIFITNVPLRGLWSVIVILFIVLGSIILALLDAWETIMHTLSLLDIRINMGGYLFLSTILFVLWLVVFLLFDQQIYMIFSPGQFRVRLEIGGAETAYDTSGMTIQKQRSDVFRHWVLGLGSGDLIVKTSGAQAHTFEMPNVLFLGRKVKQIEDLMKSKSVVTGGR